MLSSCHIFHKQTKYLKSLALLPFPITGYENGMMLCPNCHAIFDDMLNPGWIFVPADLEYFINYELEDRRTRQNIQHRAVPDPHDYLKHQIETRTQPANATMPTYTRYAMGSEQWDTTLISGDKEWHVHPLAAIRMAWRALGAVRNETVPVEVREKLSCLLDLYRNTNGGGDGGGGGDESGETKGKRKAGESPESGPSQRKRRSRPTVKKTQAAERPRREGAGKQNRLVWLNERVEPLYDRDEDIMKWAQAVEPDHGPPTPESVQVKEEAWLV